MVYTNLPTTVTFRTDSDLLLQRGDRYGKVYPGYQRVFFSLVGRDASLNRNQKPRMKSLWHSW